MKAFPRITPTSILIALSALFVPVLHAAPKLPKVTVAHEGKADFHTVQEAVDHAPDTGEIIHIAPGTYKEKLSITKSNIHLVGTGSQPQDVILTLERLLEVRWRDLAFRQHYRLRRSSTGNPT